MMKQNLSAAIKITRVSNAAAAATTDVESSAVDMQGFEGVMFLAMLGTITSGAVTSIKAQQSSDNGVADAWSDLEGTAVTVADDDDNQVFGLDIFKPLKRYVRCVVDRGTQNAVVDGVVAMQYGARVAPTTQDATTVGAVELHVSPDEGTA